MMQVAFGKLYWAPETFYSATPKEFFAAWQGWQEKERIRAERQMEIARWQIFWQVSAAGAKVNIQDIALFDWEKEHTETIDREATKKHFSKIKADYLKKKAEKLKQKNGIN